MRAYEILLEYEYYGVGQSYGAWIDNNNKVYKINGEGGHEKIINDIFGSDVHFRAPFDKGWVRALWEHSSLNLDGNIEDIKRVLRLLKRELRNVDTVYLSPLGSEPIVFILPRDKIKIMHFINE